MKRTLSIAASFLLIACDSPGAPKNTPALGRRLIAGEEVACALNTAGYVFCWGINSIYWEYGAAPAVVPGSGSPFAAFVPSLMSLARGVAPHFCGIDRAKQAICWARGGLGQLGGGVVGSTTGNLPDTVVGGIHWTDLSVGRLLTCGVADTGAGYCWGLDQQGDLGSTTFAPPANVSTPTIVDGGYTFKSITAGWVHACGIIASGAAVCWGGNASGQLGIGTADTVVKLSPVTVSGGLTFTQLSLGSRYTCGLTTASDAYCWGENATGQLGDGTTTPRPVPTLVSGGLKFKEIVASSGFATGALVAAPVTLQGGVGHTCAITTDGHAYCWGWNGSGELGDGTRIDKLVPTAVSGGLTFGTIAVGGAYSCGMLNDSVWCWGSDINGQIGKGEIGTTSAVTPQPVHSPFGPP